LDKSRRRHLLFATAVSTVFFFGNQSSATAESSVLLRGHVPPQVRAATKLGRVASDENVELSLVLRLDQSLLDQTLARIHETPATGKKRFLSSAEFGATFDLDGKRRLIKDFAASAGLSIDAVHDRPGSLIVKVSGPAGRVEKAFGVELNNYRGADGRIFRGHETDPSIPISLLPHLSAVLGLSNVPGIARPHLRAHPNSVRVGTAGRAAPASSNPAAQLNGTHGFSGTLAPSDIATIYSLSGSLNGSGQTVALVEFDGYNTSDIQAYESNFGLPNASVTFVSVDDAQPNECGETLDQPCDCLTLTGRSNCQAAVQDDGMLETAMDIELVIALSSGASIRVYTASDTISNIVDVYDRIQSENAAQVVSTSWGFAETAGYPAAMTSESAIFETMAVRGQTVFAAAGDHGAYDFSGGGIATDDPASQPYVTGVGGTSLSGTVGGTITETVWNEDPGCDSFASCEAGGGGVADFIVGSSTDWPLPSYQALVPGTTSQTYRNVPDVALNADPNSGYGIVVGDDSGTHYGWEVGGTSAAAPLWGALTSLIDQQRSANGLGSLGFANPVLYQLGTGSSYGAVFNDITSGDNGFYVAGTGYDNASGWGSFHANALIGALGGSSPNALPSGCAAGFNVAQNGTQNFTTISAALSALPSTLTGDTCIVIRDAQTYTEQVTVQNINSNGYSLIIEAPSGAAPPTIEPPSGSTAAVQVLVASVTLSNIDIQFASPTTYGVVFSSNYDSLNGVNLSDQGEFIGLYGVLMLANGDGVYDSTVSITGAVPESVVATLGGTIGDIPVAVYLQGGSSDIIAQSNITSVYGMGVYFDGSSGDEIVASAVNGGISLPFGCSGAECSVWPYDSILIDDDSGSNLIRRSILSGYGLDVFGAQNTIDQSTITFAYNYALLYYCSPSYALMSECLGSYYYLAEGSQFIYGLSIDPGAANTTITRTVSGWGANFGGDSNTYVANSSFSIIAPGFPAVLLQQSSADAFIQSYALGSTAIEVLGSTGTAIRSSALADPFASGEPVWFTQGSSSLTLASDSVVGGQYGLLLDPPGAGPSVVVAGLTFSSLSPGATAIDFSGGVFVATFSAVSFDASVGANVNAVSLTAGSRITMNASSGPRTGPMYDDDPFGYVQWNWPSLLSAAPVTAAAPYKIFTATAALRDGVSGTPLAGQSILFDFEGTTETAITNALGLASAPFNSGLLIGSTIYTAAFAGDVTYVAAFASAAVIGTLTALPPTTLISTPTNAGSYSDLPSFAGSSSDTVTVSTVELSLMDASLSAPSCYAPATGLFTEPCPAWFAAQGSTAAWAYALALQPWTQGHSYVLYSSATNVVGEAQLFATSATFTFASSTPTLFYAGVDVGPSGVVLGGQAALIRFSLSTPQGGIALASVTVQESGTASDADVSDVFLYRDSGGGAFNPAGDALVGYGSMRGGICTVILSTPQALAPGQPLTYFAAYSVSASAVVGDTIGALIAAPADVAFSPAISPLGNFPTSSRLVPIVYPPQPSGITNVSSYPNPVDLRSGPATIAFNLPQAGDVTIRIMSLFGAKLRELHANGGVGRNTVSWDGGDDTGRKVSMGVYLAVIQAAGTQAVEKIAVLR
jgi:kumamolisin